MEKNSYKTLAKIIKLIVFAQSLLFGCSGCVSNGCNKLSASRKSITILFLGYYSNDKVRVTSGDELVYQGIIKGNDSTAFGGSNPVNVLLDRNLVIDVYHNGHYFSETISLSSKSSLLSVQLRDEAEHRLYLKWLDKSPHFD